ARYPHARPHDHRHRSPALDDRACRPHRRARARPRGRAGHPRRASGARGHLRAALPHPIRRRARGGMKIVHTESSLGWGGQELRILAESQGLARRGHELTLLCPPEARIHAEAPGWGLRTVALPIGRKRLAGLLALRRWLRANRCDVLSTHSSTDSWLAALAAGRKLPIVRTRHISAPVARNAF